MKQTAVEWLVEQFRITNSYSYISETFKQAKEMEKQQIIDAHLAGQNSAEEVDGETEIEYYNETYKPSA
jgi:hypothetical protein